VARKRGVPAYVVRYDATIDGIATARPTISAQLRASPAAATRSSNIWGESWSRWWRPVAPKRWRRRAAGGVIASCRQKCHSNCHGAAQRRAVPKCPVFPGGM